MRSIVFHIVLLMTTCVCLQAQDQPRITLNLNRAPFDAFVREVEAQANVRFYYDARWTDTLAVTITTSRLPLYIVLNQVFSNTILQYAVHDQQVFLTAGRPILAELPGNFFREGSDQPSAEQVDYSDYLRRQQQQQQEEEKLYAIGARTTNLQGTATITGTIRDNKTGEPLIGASVLVVQSQTGAATNTFGSYSLTLPKGRHTLRIQSIGMKTTIRQVMVYANGKLDIHWMKMSRP
jgi:hypothetical protein